jgi:hypothetical protein
MAIRIPILTSFDGKGLKSANAAFGNLSNQVASLGRNFAVVGAAAVGIGAFLGKAVGSASDLQESVNAVNVAFGSSAAGILEFGETAATSLGTSQVAFNNAAVRFSAFADRIVGQGGDVAGFVSDISVRASDFASVFNIEVSEALGVFQSGLAGEAEPLKRFGINLLDNEVKAYAAANSIGEVGRQLTETEKVQARYGLLMQETSKTSGDFANTSDGLANSMRIMKAEIADTQAEIGQQLLPVLEEIVPVVRELVDEFGTKLLAAVKAVDWKSLLTTFVNFTTFLVENAEVIGKVVIAMFALDTMAKLVNIAIALQKVAVVLHTAVMGIFTTKVTLATAALKLFRTALITTGVGAIIVGLGFLAEWMINSSGATDEATDSLKGFNDEYDKLPTGADARERWIDGAKSPFTLPDLPSMPDLTGGDAKAAAPTGPTGIFAWLGRAQEEASLAAKEIELIGAGLSAAVAKSIVSSADGLGAANDALFLIATGGLVHINAMTEAFNKSAEGQALAFAEAERVAAEAAEAMAEIERQAQAERDRAAAAEQAALDKRENAYKSFTDSVKQLFGQIKDSILSSFNLPTLGNSVNSITRNIGKLLEKTKGFANSISQLSGMGLNSALLQQVIQAGPLAGSRLASAIVGGGSAFISQLNSAYGEMGGLASGIAGIGTGSAFANQAVVNNYNIEVNGGVGSGPTIGKAIVDAIKSYERTSGAVWQGA